MKMLFISQRVNDITSGARVVSETNLQIVQTVFGSDNITLFSISKIKKNKLNSIIHKARGYLDGLTHTHERQIIKYLSQNKFDYVYIDSSYFGKIAYSIRRSFPDVKIIIFYHDILVHWWKETHDRAFLSYVVNLFFYWNSERKCARNSDISIVMTDRDRRLLISTYGISSDSIRIIPLSIPEVAVSDESGIMNHQFTDDAINLLFVGVDYKPNVDGLRWFIAHVMPKLRDCILSKNDRFNSLMLHIVGKGMENYREEMSARDISVHGLVDNLAVWYQGCDAVVVPLFSGSGMKVKTAEALSWGKPLFSTSEGLTGYNIDGVEGIYRCDDVDSFIESLQRWFLQEKQRKRVDEIHRLFLKNYSREAAVGLFKKVIDS